MTKIPAAQQEPSPSPRRQLNTFIDRYSPEVARVAKQSFASLRRRLPTATVLVYDNYNALAIGFGPDARSSTSIFSLVLWPRWVSLFFLQGSGLADPAGLLQGTGKRVRHVVLQDASDLDRAQIRALMEGALSAARVKLPDSGRGRILIKAVSARQRPRRPR